MSGFKRWTSTLKTQLFNHGPLRYDAKVRAAWQFVRSNNLTYLSRERLASLLDLVCEIESVNTAGDIIEAGCALGGSAIAICAAKGSDRRLRIFDVFEMIPAPSERDGPDVHARYEEIAKGSAIGISGQPYYGYVDNLMDVVTESFQRAGFPIKDNNVALQKGLLADTLEIDGPVALAHIDVDWYDSVMTCLQRITPFLVEGGAIILDDYYDWSGCQRAVGQFLNSLDGRRLLSEARAGHLILRSV